MHAAIADKREKLADLCRRYGVVQFEVFGLAAHGTDFDLRRSDVDFLVKFDAKCGLDPFDQFFDLAEAMRHTLGRPVHLVEFGTIRNPYLRATMDRSCELVYAA